MRDLSVTLLLAAIAIPLTLGTTAKAQGYHLNQGYTRDNGTYVQPHYQTNPDNNTANNWSTRGNTNPYTGQPGTHNPNPTYSNPYRRSYP